MGNLNHGRLEGYFLHEDTESHSCEVREARNRNARVQALLPAHAR